jgi:molybdate/tungstate transport system substrate-binding protein
VAYAGSLQLLDNEDIGPAFQHATGIKYQGQGGGSFGIAHEISADSIPANVFESIGYAPIEVLEPHQTSWAIQIAASPLVLAYNPRSPYAAKLNQIRTGHLPLRDAFIIMSESGFKLGRTNPNTDPQGQAFVMMVKLGLQQYHLPPGDLARILGPITSGPEIYTEEGVLSLLQSGGLDASSAFLSEAVERHLSYIPLPDSLNFAAPQDAAQYHRAHITLGNGTVIAGTPLTVDVTTVGVPPSASADSFVRYLQSNPGRTAIQHAGYTVFTPRVLGDASKIPPVVRSALPHA